VYVHVSSPECKKNYNIKAGNKYVENMAKIRYLGMTVKNQTWIHRKVKSKLNFVSCPKKKTKIEGV
jgi:hypothetical protein